MKLPFLFDEEKLCKDLDTINNNKWFPMLYKHNYEGGWKSVALYAPDGDPENIFAHNDSSEVLKPTPILENCNYFKEVISYFKAPILSVRLLRLSVGSIIKPHKDYKMGYEDHNFRIHIPITTNEQVSFLLDNEKLVLLPGHCWYINANFTHAVSNFGEQDRVHLVIDVERNDWSDKLFFSLAPKESFGLKDDQSNVEVMKKIIAEFKRNGLEIPESYKEQTK